MRYSILIPVYNVEAYIENCLETVFDQTYRNYEVVLVDDGSTDCSGQICDKYKEKYPDICKVLHKENAGLISARREGIRLAESDYCIFVDSDDFVETTLLETVDNYISRHEDVDMLLYSYRYHRNGKRAERYPVAAMSGQLWEGTAKKAVYEKFITTTAFTSIWTKAIKTSILKEDPTDYTQYYKYNMSEDILQALYPLTAAKKIMYIDDVLYNYRINDESISRSFYPATIKNKSTLHVYKKIEEYLPLWGMDTLDTRNKLKARWFNDFMYMMSRYYESAETEDDKTAILQYNWDDFLPEEAFHKDNQYENESYKKLYSWLKTQDYKAIERYFKRKHYIQKYKKVKREIKSCLKREK